jgi:short-subunit dehydrogenase
MKTIQGKRILITGAAMGMGRLYALLAAREGAAAIALWDVNETELKKTTEELKKLVPPECRLLPAIVDVSSSARIDEAAGDVKRTISSVDIIINNAGIVCGKYFWEHDARKDIERTMDINTMAPMLITKAFLSEMIASRDECRIVNIASAAGLLSNPRMSVYAASKWALIGWSDSLRLELQQAGHRHVRVTTVCPSYISTGMFDGVKAPFLTPILKPETVVRRTWAAMKTGRPQLLMPFMVKMSVVLKGLLPLPLWDWFAGRLFGVYSSMAHFHGHDQ